MLLEESIYDMQKRFTHIVNHLVALDKNFETEELNIKNQKLQQVLATKDTCNL